MIGIGTIIPSAGASEGPPAAKEGKPIMDAITAALTKKVGPVPYWAIGLVVVAGGGYLLLRKKKA